MTAGFVHSRQGISCDVSSAIDELFKPWDRDRSPGAVLAVCHQGNVIHQRGYGVANIEDDIPFSGQTVLRLGSTTKHLCATCILVLENRGELRLEDDIRRFVPELPDFGTIITLRHLLSMTSGLWDGLNMLLFAGLDTGTALSQQTLQKVYCAQRRLMYAPGDDCSYSNTNYSLLSLLIERVSGLSLADFMTRELFKPLGMAQTRLTRYMSESIPNKARGYSADEKGFAAAYMMVELDGAGGVDTTVEDMLRWFRNYRNDQCFGPDYRQRLESEVRLNDGRLMEYRLGIEVRNYRGQPVVRHAGGMPGYLSDFVYFPQADLGLVLLTNLIEPAMLTLPNKVADIVLADQFEKPAATMFVPSQRRDIAPCLGVYASFDHGLLVELADYEGELVAFLLGELNPLQEIDGWLKSRKSPFELRLVNGGAEASLDLRLGCEPLRRLERISDPRVSAFDLSEDLETFAGSYFSNELAEQHQITCTGGTLRVDIASPLRNLVWDQLTPVGNDLFVALIATEPSCTNVTVRFLRNDAGVVAALSYSINRCREVYFRKLETDR